MNAQYRDNFGNLHPLALAEQVEARGGHYFLVVFPDGRGQCMSADRVELGT